MIPVRRARDMAARHPLGVDSVAGRRDAAVAGLSILAFLARGEVPVGDGAVRAMVLRGRHLHAGVAWRAVHLAVRRCVATIDAAAKQVSSCVGKVGVDHRRFPALLRLL